MIQAALSGSRRKSTAHSRSKIAPYLIVQTLWPDAPLPGNIYIPARIPFPYNFITPLYS
jgi:hypothetical protein